jgi:colanic acid/amylovoran biosynthesis glycosyltransferase
MSSEVVNKIGYVVKRYPRYSETFIVNEILAHEAAGSEIAIFALRPPVDSHFQDRIARVRAAVTYLQYERVRGDALWSILREASARLPNAAALLGSNEIIDGGEVQTVYQAIELALLVKDQNITHLHAHFATSATSVALLAGRLADVPVTFTAHAKDIFHESVCEAELAAKFAQADRVITVSDFNVENLSRRFPHACEKVCRIYNGLDLDDFSYEAPVQRERTIVAVGRLIEKKGFADLIEACRILRDVGVSLRCEILGGGELFDALSDQITRERLEQTIQLLGPQPQAEVIRRIRKASVMAAPCVVGTDGNRDGLPTVLLEAMALGTPCVSTPVTGIPEAIEDGESGLIVPERNPSALAAAIARLLDNDSLRVQLATAARQRIERDFDVLHSTARLRNVMQACQRGASHARTQLQETF